MNPNPLLQLLTDSEEWLMQRILGYARRHEYVKYTSTLVEAWRMSIAGLSSSLIQALEDPGFQQEFHPDEPFFEDPLSAFAVVEARRHRERGINLAMFLGLMKYYRQSYLDLVAQSALEAADREQALYFIRRAFDRMEIGFCAEWIRSAEDLLVPELQDRNRKITNEKNQYLTLFESLPNPAFLLDEAGRVLNANLKARMTFSGRQAPEADYYQSPEDMVLPPDLAGELTVFQTRDLRDWTFEKSLLTRNGPRLFDGKMTRMLDVSGKFAGTVIVLFDLTVLKMYEASLRESEERYRTVFEQSHDGVAIIQGNRHLLVNRRFVEIFGYDSPAELEGLPIDRTIHPEDRERVAEFNRKRQDGEEVLKRYEFQGLRKDGKNIFAEVSAARTSFRGEAVSLVFIRDITERRQVEEKIRLMAFHDSLTGLPNRVLFNDRFQTAVAQARRTGQVLTLMMIDLDHFKTVNDTLGHEAGDRLLQEVAGRLQAAVREMDTVARLGGDEFIILLPGVGNRDDICKTADRILRQGGTEVAINGRRLSITLSIGIAVSPENGEDLKTLVHQADAAMYRVKETGRNRYCFAEELIEPEQSPIRKVGRAEAG